MLYYLFVLKVDNVVIILSFDHAKKYGCLYPASELQYCKVEILMTVHVQLSFYFVSRHKQALSKIKLLRYLIMDYSLILKL